MFAQQLVLIESDISINCSPNGNENGNENGNKNTNMNMSMGMGMGMSISSPRSLMPMIAVPLRLVLI